MIINLYVEPKINPYEYIPVAKFRYPEIEIKADDYYMWFYSYISDTTYPWIEEITIITYSPFIIDCIEVIAAELDAITEVNKYLYRIKVDDFETLYREFTGHINAMETKRFEKRYGLNNEENEEDNS